MAENENVLRNYSRKDIKDIRDYLVKRVNDICKEYNIEGWTDHNESDLGMVFIELAAGIADMLNFNLDNQALETYLPTAVQRKNVKNILSLINYEMKGPVSAVTRVNFTLDEPVGIDLEIPKYFQIAYKRYDDTEVFFVTKESCVIPKGETEVKNIPVMQGTANEDHLTVADLLRNRIIGIDSDEVAEGSIELIVDGIHWTKVDDVLLDDEKGTKYSVHEDEDDKPYIEFGYNYEDFLPEDKDADVTINFVTCIGAAGSIAAEKIDTIEDDIIIGSYNYADNLKVINPEPAVGGADRETIDEARIKAPAYLKSSNLMVTLKDYENITNHFQGICKSKAVDWNTDSGKYIDVPYKVRIYVVTKDNKLYTTNSQYLSELRTYLNQYKWSSIILDLQSAVFRKIDISAIIYTSANKDYYQRIKLDAINALNEFFKKENRSFGEKFTLGKLENAITSSNDAIDYSEMVTPKSILKLDTIEFPELGDVNIQVESV